MKEYSPRTIARRESFRQKLDALPAEEIAKIFADYGYPLDDRKYSTDCLIGKLREYRLNYADLASRYQLPTT